MSRTLYFEFSGSDLLGVQVISATPGAVVVQQNNYTVELQNVGVDIPTASVTVKTFFSDETTGTATGEYIFDYDCMGEIVATPPVDTLPTPPAPTAAALPAPDTQPVADTLPNTGAGGDIAKLIGIAILALIAGGWIMWLTRSWKKSHNA